MAKKSNKQEKEVQEVQSDIMSLIPSQIAPIIQRKMSRVDSKGQPKPFSAPLIWGASGIGKSNVVSQIAKKRDSRLVLMPLVQYDPTDVKGIPIKTDEGIVLWMVSSNLPQQKVFMKFVETDADGNPQPKTSYEVKFEKAESVAVYMFDSNGNEVYRHNDAEPELQDIDMVGAGNASVLREGNVWTVKFENMIDPEKVHKLVIEDKAIIFLDEISTAEPSTQNAALILLLEREVGDYQVPHAVPMIAAGNRENDGAFVQPLSHPLCNRFTHYTMIPDVNDWISWAMRYSVHPDIVAFIKFCPDALHDYKPDSLAEGRYGFATPRTWEMLARQYEGIEFYLDIANGDASMANTLRMADLSGFVGAKRASQFASYLVTVSDLPSPQEVMAGTAKPLDNVEVSTTWGLLYALVTHIFSLYKEHYDHSRDYDKQGDKWVKAKDNILYYVTKNYDNELGSWFYAMIRDIDPEIIPTLRSKAFFEFSNKFSDSSLLIKKRT